MYFDGAVCLVVWNRKLDKGPGEGNVLFMGVSRAVSVARFSMCDSLEEVNDMNRWWAKVFLAGLDTGVEW